MAQGCALWLPLLWEPSPGPAVAATPAVVDSPAAVDGPAAVGGPAHHNFHHGRSFQMIVLHPRLLPEASPAPKLTPNHPEGVVVSVEVI